ncbi:ANTAR domain-containing response regulator [Photobacterium swingsii]|uniref:ANTAR domain-containing protein n=1 Tax=Photobacterium swingsii TaxID=680026 RepID=A0A0J8V8R2_9GAMM|nr:ANTAR domain-containing protein [Photobacterium swingsii]KMV29808.1 transcriptional regulator [Photobacterium swingsii]PSW22794.1 ANTAR domain-containing protein [Photobacterium swingsii]
MQGKPLIVCSDNLQQQAAITGRLAVDYDKIIGCTLHQLEVLVERYVDCILVVSWQRPSAELSMIVDHASCHKIPLLILLRQLNQNDINRLPEPNGYVMLPADSQFDLSAWVFRAEQVRQCQRQQESEIEQLTQQLADRKWVEKAKGLLMQHHGLDEESAFKALRTASMNNSQSLAQVARNIVHTLSVISGSRT